MMVQDHDRGREVVRAAPHAPLRTAPAIVAIPANNEADRIGACLAALGTQRDHCGAPLDAGAFEVLVFANNCTDRTVEVAEAFAEESPYPIRVVVDALPASHANAGCARKCAMDLAAARLTEAGHANGVILTTDADSIVASTWVDGNLREIVAGADCVAGYIDAIPTEIVRLGPAFLRRGRLEDRYLSLIAAIYARCDPRPHDPWPNHRVSSGASLAITLSAYRAVGGLPPVALGEDAALTHAVECAGLRVRHSLSVVVATSCRFDGRAQGGAADTMRLRHAIVEAPCDADIEPALIVLRRALLRGGLRSAHALGLLRDGRWPRRLGMSREAWGDLVAETRDMTFAAFWARVETASPVLGRRHVLRPSELPPQITRSKRLLGQLHDAPLRVPRGDRGGTDPRSESHVTMAV